MNVFQKLRATIAFNAACSAARALQKKDGKRRFLIPFNSGEMEVLTKEEALALKKNGQLAKDLTAKTIYGACFFFTDTDDKTASVKCEMPSHERRRRRAFFYTWFEKHHKS